MNKFRGECEVVVDGEKLSMTFSVYTFFLFCEKMGVSLDQMEKALSKPTAIGTLMWSAIKTNCEHKGVDCKYSVVDVAEMLSLMTEDQMRKVNETIESAMSAVDDTKGTSKKK